MNLKKSIGRERRIKDVDVNIIPVMNIFLLLIPFLLLTAAFVRLAIVEISLPTLGKSRTKQVQETPKNLVLIFLAIKENGFQLKSDGFKFKPVKKISNQYNYGIIIEQLKQIKNKHPYAEDIFIIPEANVKYDIIIKVMDRCREIGFSNVALTG